MALRVTDKDGYKLVEIIKEGKVGRSARVDSFRCSLTDMDEFKQMATERLEKARGQVKDRGS